MNVQRDAPSGQMGLAEFNTAAEFMRSAHELIYATQPTPGSAARSLINLTFLALEIALKCHLKNLTGTFPKTHNLPALYEALRADSEGKKRTDDIAQGYAKFVGLTKGRPNMEHNWEFNSLEKLLALLTKKTFIEWRYFFEGVEEEILAGRKDLVRFPFFNVYLVTWVFLVEAADLLGDTQFPRRLEYPAMPYWFRVRANEEAPGTVVWETFVTSLAMGTGGPLRRVPPIFK